jgi:hypothetical protein
VEPSTKGLHSDHDFMQQGQGFAYLSRLLSPITRLTLMTGLSMGNFEIPTNPAWCRSTSSKGSCTILLLR